MSTGIYLPEYMCTFSIGLTIMHIQNWAFQRHVNCFMHDRSYPVCLCPCSHVIGHTGWDPFSIQMILQPAIGIQNISCYMPISVSVLLVMRNRLFLQSANKLTTAKRGMEKLAKEVVGIEE